MQLQKMGLEVLSEARYIIKDRTHIYYTNILRKYLNLDFESKEQLNE